MKQKKDVSKKPMKVIGPLVIGIATSTIAIYLMSNWIKNANKQNKKANTK